MVLDVLKGWWKSARPLVRKGAVERELGDELAFHVAMETEKNVRAGMPPGEARRAALVAFRGVERYKEEVRAARRTGWLESLWRDVRMAARSFRRSPGVAALVALTLGLGIGATTVIFGVVDAAVLRPLPWPDPEELVLVKETTPAGSPFTVSQPNYVDFRARSSALSELAAFQETSPTLTGEGGEPEQLEGVRTTHTLFGLLGARAVVGRPFTAAEDRPGGDTRVVALSHGLWERRFGADPGIVGRRITVDGNPHLVTGVLAPEFELFDAELFLPLAPDPEGDRLDHWLDVIGRLAPGATAERAAAELTAVSASLAESEPAMAGWGARVTGLHEELVGPAFRQASRVLAGAVALLLLMACANAANLLLARATARQGDLGIRAAMGAGRGRLVRQLLTESLLLAGAGGLVGLVAASWTLGAIRVAAPAAIPRVEDAGVDLRVVAFATAVALGTALLAGLLPALQAARTDPAAQLTEGVRAGTSRRRRQLRDGLVVAQVAVTLVLLVGAGLLTRSYVRLQSVDAGFDVEDVFAVRLRLPEGRYSSNDDSRFFAYRDILERVRTVPGVTDAAIAFVDPFSGRNLVNDVTPADRAAEFSEAGYMQAGWRPVSPEYFGLMRIPLLRGRNFTSDDRYGRPPTVIVSRTLAERLWPGEDPIGKGLFWGGTDGEPRTVIGVVGDIRDVVLDEEPAPLIFLSYRQLVLGSSALLVRTEGEVAGLAAAVRRAVWAVDSDVPVPEVFPVKRSRAAAVAGPRFNATVLAVFAAVALTLAAVGLYGLLTFLVASRTREIGVRRALGARAGEISRMVVLRGLRLAGTGILLGLAAAFGLARLVEGLLFGTTGTDPLTFVAAPAIFAAVALLASWIPARRALRVDPMMALRSE